MPFTRFNEPSKTQLSSRSSTDIKASKAVIFLLGITLPSLLLGDTSAQAQSNIVPDTTLGAEQSGVVPIDDDGFPIDVIEGGAIRGANLFHSFLEFNVAENRGAYFFVPINDIENILSRVTGDNSSEILGTLGTFNGPGVTAAPTLYLMNPNGILFGPNAVLDLPASFLATTADAIALGEGGLFSAHLPETSTLLSVDPSALLFGASPPDPIINQAVLGFPAAGFLINGPLSPPQQILPDGTPVPLPRGVQVVDGQTLGLVGGDILLEGFTTSIGGRVDIGSVQAGRVGLTNTDNGFTLNYPDDIQFGNLELSGSGINTSGEGGGAIQLQAARIFSDTEGAFSGISADTQGAIDGQGIFIRATDALFLEDAAITATVAPGSTSNGGNITVESPAVSIIGGISSILTRNFGGGRAGDIAITTHQFQTLEGAGVLTNTLGPGDGGNLTITATESVELSGTAIFAGEEQAGGLSADIRGTGTGGRLTVTTGQLTLQDGANISARTDDGPGGSIFIAADDVDLLGGSIQAQTFGRGDAGDITIRTQRLSISDGNEITATSILPAQGDAGNIDVIASESIDATGVGGLTTAVIGPGNGGDLTIQTGDLTLRDGANITAQAFFTFGRGGSVDVTADRIEVSGRDGNVLFPSQISTTTSSGSGEAAGDLTLNTRELLVSNGGEISANTLGGNAAGNLVIFADDAIEVTGTFINSAGEAAPSRISASTSAFGGGEGGSVTLTTQRLEVSEGAEINVSSQGEGAAGNLTVNARTLRLLDAGKVIATSASGDGGNLIFQLDESLLLRNGSQISTSAGTAQTFGDGGNITITAPFVVAIPEEDSDITANAFLGSGGSVNIFATGIFGLEFRPETTPLSDITASSDFGTTGDVNLNALDTDFIEDTLTELPESPVTTDRLLAGSCIAQAEGTQGSFVITGGDSLPTRPGDSSTSAFQTGEVRSLADDAEVDTAAGWQRGDPMVEPAGIYQLADGRIVLSHPCE